MDGGCFQDERLLDNTHLAKQKFGLSAGDSWADKASEDLLKVKGKGPSISEISDLHRVDGTRVLAMGKV